jgi:cytochrome c-type biogenesis protein CcmH/NrfF
MSDYSSGFRDGTNHGLQQIQGRRPGTYQPGPRGPGISTPTPPSAEGATHSLIASPIFWARTVQILLLCLVTIGMIGATRSQYDRVGNQLMCSCGCGQILLQCNHVGCPDSPVMIRELHAQVAGGGSDKAIFDWFANKYGAIILAAPMLTGFDRVAWIVPIAVFLLATIGTFAIVWFWKRRALTLAPALPSVPPPADPALRDQIRHETEY